MAGELIVLDPITEDSANAPLALSGDEANGVALLEHDYPDPPDEMQWAGSVDTEGRRRASTTPGNRTITAKVRVAEPTDAAATNIVTNPSFETGTTSWAVSGVALNAGATLTQDSSMASIGDYCGKVITTAASNSQGLQFSFSATNGVTYAVTIRVQRDAGGADLFIGVSNGVSDFTIATTAQPPTSSFQTYAATFTATSTATHYLFVRTKTATVTTFRVDAALVAVASAVMPYFDGDTPGCYWTGTRHASTSTRWGTGGDRFNAIRADVQQKITKLHAEGGTYRRILPNGDPIIFDVVAARVTGQTDDKRAAVRRRMEIGLEFECKPYGREPEVTLSDHTETTALALVATETDIRGDAPGLGRLVIDNDSANAQHWLWWGIRSRYYSSASTAALLYEAEAATMVSGTTGADATASGGSRVRLATGSATFVSSFKWTNLTHIGAYRVLARVKADNTALRIRAYWAGLGPEIFTANEEVVLDGDANWYIRDLGIVTPGMATPPGQPWTLEVQGRKATGGAAANLDVDAVFLIPISEGSGEAQGLLTLPPVAPAGSPLLPASGSFTIRHDAALKGPDGSSQYGPPYRYEGDYLLIPPAGREKRTLQFIVKMIRGELATSVMVPKDYSIDDLSARLYYTPRWRTVPRPS